MNRLYLPEVTLNDETRLAIRRVAASFHSIAEAEACALKSAITRPLDGDTGWQTFQTAVTDTLESRGYAVVRRLDVDEGRSLLIAAATVGAAFATYGPGHVVKRFRMSPWATELSHTLRAGDFHTDGNVSDDPPTATAIQCENEDPGGSEYAEQRVAYLPDLLAYLKEADSNGGTALAFLTGTDSAMGHAESVKLWRGRLVQAGVIRYHPFSLRVAAGRLGHSVGELEPILDVIHRGAMAVSISFHSNAGDLLLVSNQKALHYRGECSVRFTKFPTEYISRSMLVAHRVGLTY
jgi:hypothetical protein